jgi:hypothetical protein
MNVHRNARLAPLGRAVMIARIEHNGCPVARAAEASGVSRRTAYLSGGPKARRASWTAYRAPVSALTLCPCR